jgi:glycerol-3-phosphate dehydrogenase
LEKGSLWPRGPGLSRLAGGEPFLFAYFLHTQQREVSSAIVKRWKMELKMNVQGRLETLKNKEFDLIIIGGGVIGAGVARDAAMRGLKVALFEKYDYASGTSSRSTRLIHGGLRYLEMFDFGLVRQDLKEREILLRIAPHLVKPLAFIVPFYRRSLFYRTKLLIGMYLYDWLSFDKSLPNHENLSKQKVLEMEPMLRPEGLQGATMYYDAQVALTERLTMENIIAAQENGAVCFNHVMVENVIKENGQVVGVNLKDELSGEKGEARAKLVINVAGPWLDPLEQKITGKPSKKVRMTKGIHFAAPHAVNNAVVLFAEQDDRLFFVIPWLGYAWVGTTDTDFDENLDSVHADASDVEYLLESVKDVFPNADWDTIYYTNAGVRALVRKPAKAGADESEVSRKHALVDHEKTDNTRGLLSVVGGKITAYRGIAEEAVDVALKKLGLEIKGRTAEEILPGGATGRQPEDYARSLQPKAAKYGLSEAQTKNLVFLYGSRVSEIFELLEADPELAQLIHPDYPDIRAQLRHAVERESCLTLSDFMMRRSTLYFTPDQGRQAAPIVSAELAKLLGWSTEERQRQEAMYAQELSWTQQWREAPAPVIAGARG